MSEPVNFMEKQRIQEKLLMAWRGLRTAGPTKDVDVNILGYICANMPLTAKILIAFTLLTPCRSVQPPVRVIQLSGENSPHKVPEGKIWKADGLLPYASDTGVGTAELLFCQINLVSRCSRENNV